MAKTQNIPKPNTIRIPEKYGGQYIAKRSWRSKSIIAHSQNMDHVIKRAEEQGIMEPIIMFVPKRDMACIY